MCCKVFSQKIEKESQKRFKPPDNNKNSSHKKRCMKENENGEN